MIKRSPFKCVMFMLHTNCTKQCKRLKYFQALVTGSSPIENYFEDKMQIFVVEFAYHILGYIVYLMLCIGAKTRRTYLLVPFISHSIAGISLLLGGAGALFSLGLKDYKKSLYMSLAAICILSLIVDAIFLTFTRQLYLEIKKKKDLTTNEEKNILIQH